MGLIEAFNAEIKLKLVQGNDEEAALLRSHLNAILIYRQVGLNNSNQVNLEDEEFIRRNLPNSVHFTPDFLLRMGERERRFLEIVAYCSPHVCSKKRVIKYVYSDTPSSEGRLYEASVDKLVSRVRDKLSDSSSNPQILITIPGRGYLYRCPNNS